MSIQSLRASLALLNTTPNAQVSYNAPPRTIYHQIAQDVMLIQGFHHAVEEALANVGELASPDPPLDPRHRCLLRLRQNLIDIAQISDNFQERMLQNILSYTSTSQTQTVIEDVPVPRPVTQPSGNVPSLTTSVPLSFPCTEGSDEVVAFRWDPLVGQPTSNPIPPSPPPGDPALQYQAVFMRRSKRKASDQDNTHSLELPPAKRPRRDPNGSIYLRPSSEQRERPTVVWGWASRIFSRPGQ